ncbi:hypothetical protein DUNSADRAFT_2634 [Dunaliella salina]|uniref:Encoded protein n=1 Tax=Dunaliella salina TaxID=3046 RepID=A0ABQ7FW57_DUNSA|nr:hypothetical protein DUNSADRAFT_2634 [Dunaliella salina]|eukprot:KAF5826583.1 hypothetical protein DUNSADRAFT_2634 [Dunaliella salina]
MFVKACMPRRATLVGMSKLVLFLIVFFFGHAVFSHAVFIWSLCHVVSAPFDEHEIGGMAFARLCIATRHEKGEERNSLLIATRHEKGEEGEPSLIAKRHEKDEERKPLLSLAQASQPLKSQVD